MKKKPKWFLEELVEKTISMRVKPEELQDIRKNIEALGLKPEKHPTPREVFINNLFYKFKNGQLGGNDSGLQQTLQQKETEIEQLKAQLQEPGQDAGFEKQIAEINNEISTKNQEIEHLQMQLQEAQQEKQPGYSKQEYEELFNKNQELIVELSRLQEKQQQQAPEEVQKYIADLKAENENLQNQLQQSPTSPDNVADADMLQHLQQQTKEKDEQISHLKEEVDRVQKDFEELAQNSVSINSNNDRAVILNFSPIQQEIFNIAYDRLKAQGKTQLSKEALIRYIIIRLLGRDYADYNGQVNAREVRKMVDYYMSQSQLTEEDKQFLRVR